MTSSDGFKFWASYYDALKALDTDKQRSDFMLALCAYVFDGIEPEFDDPVVRFGYTLVAEQARQSMEISRAAQEKGRRGGKQSGKTRAKRSTASSAASRAASSVSRCVGALAPNTSHLSVSARDQTASTRPPLPTRPAGADAPPPLP